MLPAVTEDPDTWFGGRFPVCRRFPPQKFASPEEQRRQRYAWLVRNSRVGDCESIVADALSLLVDLDWLSERLRETEGRTATVYEVNPRAIP